MSITVATAIANTREMMDATSSARWTDAFITTALGIVSWREWSGILRTDPMYRFAQRTVTTASDGTTPYSGLDSGAADTKQNWFKVLSITDGQRVFRQTDFAANPLATSTISAAQILAAPQWYEAGTNIQIVPAASVALTISVNHRPPRVDQLAGTSSTIDFPDGRETILWLEAAAYLLAKGGLENAAGQTMRAMADQERQDMYADLRRSTRPQFLQFADPASDWGAG